MRRTKTAAAARIARKTTAPIRRRVLLPGVSAPAGVPVASGVGTGVAVASVEAAVAVVAVGVAAGVGVGAA